MKLYDTVITGVSSLCASFERKNLPIISTDWPDLGKNNLIFRQDMAYELGGSSSSMPAIGMTTVTTGMAVGMGGVVRSDEMILIGKDLSEIRSDVPYARIAIVRAGNGTLGEGNALYQAVKQMEYVRYHVNPEGFMTRVSLMNARESARVSKTAIDRGLSFSVVGSMLLKEYHKNPSIQSVSLIFITDPAFPFEKLKELAAESDRITKAIDHILSTGMQDCDRCSLQKVCEEVEGLKELHANKGEF